MLRAAALALGATLIAAAISLLGGRGVTTLDWAVYDRWLRARVAVADTPSLVIVARDPAGEARFGSGAWDRAVLARVITALGRGGAAVVGLDVPLGAPSAPGRGGAASDALLAQAAQAVDLVSVMAPGVPDGKVGHTLVEPDADGVVRAAPLWLTAAGRPVPAFGLALVAALAGTPAAEIRIPVDAGGRALVDFAGGPWPRGVVVVSFLEVWTAIEQGQSDRLRTLAGDNAVLIIAEPAAATLRTPVGDMSPVAILAHRARGVLAGSRLRQAPPAVTAAVALALAALAAGLLLTARWWLALAGIVTLAAGYAVALLLALVQAEIVLPIVLPLGSLAVATLGALVTRHLASGARVRRLEEENARAHETLVHHESAVEALEEDLEAARGAVARSTGAERDLGRAADALREQLAEARRQEGATRQRLDSLERELSGLRTAEARSGPTGDAGHEALRRACEEAGILTRDTAVLAVFRDLGRAARASLPIVITGEPGTGKELFARAAHRLSARAARPFVAVNMAAIPPDLFESELFGHVKGAFTGATTDRHGYFEQADGGTIFLDEIGELRADQQSKLLRVLQEQVFHKVGAARPLNVDVRVVAASNRDLERGVAEGWFREDLWFRLKGLVLRLPPLRARPDDVPLLAARLVEEAAAELGRSRVALSEDAVAALRAHAWPGNVRELQNCLRQAVALADTPVLKREDLRLPEPERRGATVTETDDAAVLAGLRRHGFDMQATARELGWDRSTVTQRLKGLGFRALVDAGGDRARAALDLAGDPALARAVEVKLREYHEHLLRSLAAFDTAEAALAASRRRFKNLPDRHFRSLELLVRQHFHR
ncbi:MAG TPA: sigma 54-interacting transcriptional regulator [Candidatus Limnocylindria bacterium]|nr:sigma 54-interacting transcriptional regulator [Candidatus Limnocylindria bacterium]